MAPPPGPRRKVLIVDDDLVMRRLLTAVLGRDYDVVEAHDARSALDLLEAGISVDVVVSDVMMPGTDGFAFADHLKHDARFKKTPLLFLSARTSPTDVLRGISVGARAYIMKPFAADDLLDKVARAAGAAR